MMLVQSRSLPSSIRTSEKPTTQVRQSDNALLQGVIESFLDGVLILTEQGECVQANNLAHQICQQLTPDSSQPNSVPKEIWDVCQFLIESRDVYPSRSRIIESEVAPYPSTPMRIRVRWLNLNAISHPYLLVILEDRCQSIQNLALTEVEKYGLTPREAEVWLLHRANYTYKEIAEQLYISLNTVKKHLKNIQVKRETVLGMEKC
jgi:DNA-binding CsgD family transcriptional regulator